MKLFDSIKSALTSIWSNKVRSVLTVLGIVIGVSAVTILVSLGQGLKEEVSSLIRGFGSNVIAVVAGKIDPNSQGGQGMQTNPANFVAGDILTIRDVEAIEKVDGVQAVTPMSLVGGSVKSDGKTANPVIMGTYPNFTEAFEVLRIDNGSMFPDKNAKEAVLGSRTKTDLFGEDEAIGKEILVGTSKLKVIGVFAKPTASSLFGDFDTIVVVPFEEAIVLNKNKTVIHRVIVKAKNDVKVTDVKERIKKAMLDSHAGEENFTVLTQDDILGLFDQFLNLATTLVSGIASISLLVGGIGIMNIMLVTVTERTKEIGLRKAVGATKIDIGLQFLVEAIMVTLLGGFIGLGISFGVARIIAAKTALTPLITPEVILIALGVSTVVGIIFGLWPALRAANKDPIEALRYE